MRFKGRPVLGAIMGFLFFFFVALDLVFFGVLPLNSAFITVLPLLGIVVGLVWAMLGPLPEKGSPAASPGPPMA